MTTEEKKPEEQKPVCTCDDSTSDLPCPVCFAQSHKEAVAYRVNPEKLSPQVHTLTDNDLASQSLVTWEGFLLICHSCQKGRLHWQPRCSFCGVLAKTESRTAELHFQKKAEYMAQLEANRRR